MYNKINTFLPNLKGLLLLSNLIGYKIATSVDILVKAILLLAVMYRLLDSLVV